MPSLEEDAAKILVSPFGHLWQSLKKQHDAWNTVSNSLVAVSAFDRVLMKNEQQKNSISLLADNARDLLINSTDILIYPSFVGAWALIEAAFEDMIVRILISEPRAPSILEENNIKPKRELELGTQEWALNAIRKIEDRVRVQGSVVKTHQAILALFEMPLAYPEAYSETIEEINQVRNCILHRNGAIDEKAASTCPRLRKYLGNKIDKSDPIFTVYGTILADYTLAWLNAVIRGPQLRNGLKEEARNPPVYPPDFGRIKPSNNL